ncbi:MAG: hypothetical protein ABII90_05675 [Bacteroidota bacterium]
MKTIQINGKINLGILYMVSLFFFCGCTLSSQNDNFGNGNKDYYVGLADKVVFNPYNVNNQRYMLISFV